MYGICNNDNNNNNNNCMNPSRPPLMIQQSNTMTLNQKIMGAMDDKEIKIEYPEKRRTRQNISSVSSIGDIVSVGSPISPKSIMGMTTSSMDSDDDNEQMDDGEDMFNLLKRMAIIKDDETLAKHGYKKIGTICEESLQGQVFEAAKNEINPKTGKLKKKRVAIKKVIKELYAESISIEDDMSFVVEEDILKESVILNVLTIANRPPADYIAKFIEFFEDENAFYLVMEYCGNTNLLQFTERAHQYIKQKKLSLKEYQKMVKYLFWQISVMINWLHSSMNCCHLDLCMENIIVKNGNFIKNEDGTVSINPKICIKIADFGCAEIFNPGKYDNFKCGKCTLTGSYQYCAPQVYENIIYDARKADIYQLGVILYHMSVGIPIYKYQDSSIDAGFLCIQHNNIELFLKMQKLLHFVNKKLIKLLNGMLNTNEKQRVNSFQILTHEWFQVYYKKYKNRLEKTIKAQKEANKLNKHKMNGFPFYIINERGI